MAILFNIGFSFLILTSFIGIHNLNRDTVKDINKAYLMKASLCESLANDTVKKRWTESLLWPEWTIKNQKDLQIKSIDDESANIWLRWIIPLPKLVKLIGSITLEATDISLRLRSDPTDIEQFARDELANLITEKTGGKPFNGYFQILIGICDTQGKIEDIFVPGAEKLHDLKNNDQAYLISPLSTPGLAVVALTEQGVYYGVKTLQQLMKPKLYQKKLVLPVLAVMDWPDLSERGQWGIWGDKPDLLIRLVQYKAERKMNLMEVHQERTLSFDENGHGKVYIDSVSKEQARLHAIKWIPVTGHFNSLGNRTEIYKLYPHVMGVGATAHYPTRYDLVVPCASQPDFVMILSQWLESCIKQGVPELNFYITELSGMQCNCDQCKNFSQYFLETKACVKAWEIAREKYPELRIRILTSQGSYSVNDQILAAAPEPEIRISYYSGSTTYTSRQEPMIYPLLADFVKEGRWLGIYPSLTASYAMANPWCAPQFIKFRMNEIVEKGLASFSGFAPPDPNFFDFNITAAAEWSWNSYGRSEKEFAAAFATQRGFTDPKKFADWAVMLGNVGWNVYGSGIPAAFRQIATMIKKRQPPVLGKGIFLYFPTLQHIDNDLATCIKAIKLAENLNDPATLAETWTIQGYLRMIKAIYYISDLLARHKELNANQIISLQTWFNELKFASKQTNDALNSWIQTVFPGWEPIPRTQKTFEVILSMIADFTILLEPFGIK